VDGRLISRPPRLVVALGLALSLGCAAHRRLPPWQDAMSDGCSWPGGERAALWPVTPEAHRCCVAHDARYYRGGSITDRLRADEGLRACLLAAGLPRQLADFYFLFVRLGGGPEGRLPGVSWAFGGDVFQYTGR
jgi:hypothetical protein